MNEVQDVIDIFRLQYQALDDKIRKGGIKRDQFDRYAISKWAIGESLVAIDEYPGELNDVILTELLEIQLMDYVNFCESESRYKKYEIAADMMEQLIKMVKVI